MIRQDPFFDYVPERIMPKRPWLTNDQITRLMNVHTKHAFFCEFYAGYVRFFRPSRALRS